MSGNGMIFGRGGCHCGSVRYSTEYSDKHDAEVATPTINISNGAHVDIDHCGTCRKASGSLICVWYIVPMHWASFSLSTPGGLKRLSAKQLLEHVHSGRFAETAYGGAYPESSLGLYSSSAGVVRGFCKKCGTSIFYAKNGSEDLVKEWKHQSIDFTAGSLDSDVLEDVRPVEQSHLGHGIGWVVEWCKTGLFGKVPVSSFTG